MELPSHDSDGMDDPAGITTGNTFVLKAASFVRQTAMAIAELFGEAGLPPRVFNLVTCSWHEAERLLVHPKVQGVSFVGSTDVGRHIYSTAAAHGKRVQALTEAKNHALVLRDAPVRATVQRVINSAFGCAGERCMALPVIAVEEEIADELVATIAELAQERKIGPAYEEDTEMGSLVNEGHREFVLDWIDKSISEGAELVLDGRDFKVEGFENGVFVGPTVPDHVTPDMECGQEEVFGPVLYVKRVKGFDEGVELINSSEFAN